VASAGSKGGSYDNALAETINGLFKTEVIRKRGPWRTIDDVEFATREWVDWFNNRRLLEPIASRPPNSKSSTGLSRQRTLLLDSRNRVSTEPGAIQSVR